jgi:hypothetical protein
LNKTLDRDISLQASIISVLLVLLLGLLSCSTSMMKGKDKIAGCDTFFIQFKEKSGELLYEDDKEKLIAFLKQERPKKAKLYMSLNEFDYKGISEDTSNYILDRYLFIVENVYSNMIADMDTEMLLPDLNKEIDFRYFLIWDDENKIINLPIPKNLK